MKECVEPRRRSADVASGGCRMGIWASRARDNNMQLTKNGPVDVASSDGSIEDEKSDMADHSEPSSSADLHGKKRDGRSTKCSSQPRVRWRWFPTIYARRVRMGRFQNLTADCSIFFRTPAELRRRYNYLAVGNYRRELSSCRKRSKLQGSFYTMR